VSNFAEALKALIAEPSSNFAALGTAIAIVVLAVVIVLLALIAFALPSARPAAKAAPRRKTPAWIITLVGVGVFLVGTCIALTVWYEATSPAAYCTTTCHAMAAPTATWNESPHRDVACIACHEGPKWKTMPRGIVSRGRSLYYQLSGSKAGRTSVPAENCLACHTGLLDRRLTARNGQGFFHRQLLDGTRTCPTCHGAQGHTPKRY
jgi:hypothetical protein